MSPEKCASSSVVFLRRSRVLTGAAILTLALPALASHRVSDYPVRPAQEYPIKVVKADVIVAAEPMDSEEAQKTYFGAYSDAQGILPVLLVIQNTSPSDALLFDRSAVDLAGQGEITGKGAKKVAARLGSGGLIDLTLYTDASDLRENLMRKEIQSKTVPAGASVSGFLYVPVPTDGPRPKEHLQVSITWAASGEIELVNIDF